MPIGPAEGASRTREELAGKVAVVTGAASGLGSAIARELALAGMSVAILDIDGERAGATSAAISGEIGVPAIAAAVDVGDPSSLSAAAEAVAERFGTCDVVVANVGVQQFGAVERLTEEDWRWVLDVNVVGTVRTVTAFLPLVRRADGFRQVVLTSSSGVLLPGVRLGAYTASKAAVWAIGETLRLELAAEGIGVTVVFPAGMWTRHLESSALARPADLGPLLTMPDDIEAMMQSRDLDERHVVSPEYAVRNLVDDLVANEPYVITHGAYRDGYRARLEAMDRAFDLAERE